MAESTKSDGVTVLREHPVAACSSRRRRRYSRALEHEGYFQIDRKSAFFKHNDELFRFLHRQTGYLFRHVTGEMIIPSYTYLSAYREDADLERHVDRPQCVWNASLLVDTTRRRRRRTLVADLSRNGQRHPRGPTRPRRCRRLSRRGGAALAPKGNRRRAAKR